MKYKDWLHDWLKNYVLPASKDKTYKRYSEIAEKHIIPKLGELELNDITLQKVQWFITSELNEGNLKTGAEMSPSSVNLTISVVQSSMRVAHSIGLVNTYDLDMLKRPKIKEKRVECFTKPEQKLIEKAVLMDSRPKMIGILLCLYTGLRVGELMALEWGDIDFMRDELSVTKSCHDSTMQGGGFVRITEMPKTAASFRTIPIPRQIMPYLRDTRIRNGSVYVVGNKDKILSVRSYQYDFAALLKRLNIPHRGFHSLRHTFATRALECGMDARTLADILGHDNPMITLKRYAHSMEEHKKEMMNRVGKLL